MHTLTRVGPAPPARALSDALSQLRESEFQKLKLAIKRGKYGPGEEKYLLEEFVRLVDTRTINRRQLGDLFDLWVSTLP